MARRRQRDRAAPTDAPASRYSRGSARTGPRSQRTPVVADALPLFVADRVRGALKRTLRRRGARRPFARSPPAGVRSMVNGRLPNARDARAVQPARIPARAICPRAKSQGFAASIKFLKQIDSNFPKIRRAFASNMRKNPNSLFNRACSSVCPASDVSRQRRRHDAARTNRVRAHVLSVARWRSG